MGGTGPLVLFVVRRLQKPCPLAHACHVDGPFFSGQRGRKTNHVPWGMLSC